MLKLYALYRSRAFRVAWLCKESGIAYEHVDVSVNVDQAQCKEPWFAARNPNARVPVSDDDRFVMWESANGSKNKLRLGPYDISPRLVENSRCGAIPGRRCRGASRRARHRRAAWSPWRYTFPMRTFTEYKLALSRGVALHTQDWPGHEPPVLLIHPNRTINRVWDHVIAASRLPHRFLAPGLRGHGLSDYPPAGYRLADHRDDLIDFIETIGAGPMFVVGQATGAMLALMIAHTRPDLVRAVVAANPALAIPPAINNLVQSQVRAHAVLASRAAARSALPFSSRWTPAIVEHYLDHALEEVKAGAADTTVRWRYHAAGVAECEADLVHDHSEAIRSARPVLVFGGAAASVLPASIVDRVCALLPNHERALLPAADHRLSQDNPAGFAALLDDFVARHSPAVP